MQAVAAEVDDEENSNANLEANESVPSALVFSVSITVSLEACIINIGRGTNTIVYVCDAAILYKFSCLVCLSDLFAIHFFFVHTDQLISNFTFTCHTLREERSVI